MDIFKKILDNYDGLYQLPNKRLSNLFIQLRNAAQNEDMRLVSIMLESIYPLYEGKSKIFTGGKRFRKHKRDIKATKNMIKEFREIIRYPKIFLCCVDEDVIYANALRNFITDLGVDDDKLIYTAHDLHNVPLGTNVYDYLFRNIHENVLMILLWSDNFITDIECSCQIGALRATGNNYIHIFVPSFDARNERFLQFPIDTNRTGIRISNGDFRGRMIELKNTIEDFMQLDANSERKVASLIDDFIKAVS